MRKRIPGKAIITSLSLIVSLDAQAVSVNNGDTLTITTGVEAYDVNGDYLGVTSGSWFGLDLSSVYNRISGVEKTAVIGHSPGIIIGAIQTYGTLYPQTGPIDEWFFGYQGQDFTTVAVTGSTTAGLNFSGWTMKWWSATDATAFYTPMGTGAWQPGNCGAIGCSGTFTNGNAHFQWSGTYGDTYTLQYTATVPNGDPSGFGNVQYYLYLTGTVLQAVPVPPAVWLFGSGLVGLMSASQSSRRKI